MKFREKLKSKPMHSINSIVWKNFAIYAILIIVVVELLCYIIVSHAFINDTKNKLVNTGVKIQQEVETWTEMDFEKLHEIQPNSKYTDGIFIVIFARNGRVIGATDEDYIKFLDHNTYRVLVDKLQANADNYVMFRSENNVMNYGSCVEYRGGSGYLLASMSYNLLTNTLHALQWNIIMLGLLMIFVAFLVSYSIAQKLADPIRNLSITADQMAKGNYEVQFASMEYQEVANLSDSLNYAKDEIKKADEFQKEIMSNVSHDLKTPLTMIKAYASMIQEISGDNPKKRAEHLQVIIDEADRLTGLVNDVLSTSKAYSDINLQAPKVFNLTEFLYGILDKFKYLQETQGYQFMIDIDPNLYTRADSEKIGQVVYNLLSNAVNYTGADKTIYVSLKDDLEHAITTLSIRDTGKGIKAEDMANIWQRYYRVKENHVRPVKGTGLGLNIVKKILEAHKFEYGVESEQGKGATFWVKFPSVYNEPTKLDKEEKKGL